MSKNEQKIGYMKSMCSLLCILIILLGACKKKVSENIVETNLLIDSIGFSAKVITANGVYKGWKTTSASSSQLTPARGVDYFAIRGGTNADELTLMSFGKYTDDTSNNTGRLTIFIANISDTGIFKIDGVNANNAILSVVEGNNLIHYRSDFDHQGSVVISKYDTTNKTISGTFIFNLVSNTNHIQVQNGNFTAIPYKQ